MSISANVSAQASTMVPLARIPTDRAGLTEIAADVRPDTKRDAVLVGISANSAHGLPRSNADKRIMR